MSSAGRGYGEGFFYTPEDQAAQEGIRRRQAYAQALMQGRQHQGQYGGLADAGDKIAGALLGKRADKDASGLAASSQAKYAADLGKLLSGNGSGASPQISNAAGSPQEMDPEGNPMASTGAALKGPSLDPEGNPVASMQPQAPQQPQSIMDRIAQSGNPALMFQFGPQALQNQMQTESRRGEKVWENSLPMAAARQQEIAAQGQQAQSNATFQNQLPMTSAQRATLAQQGAQLGETGRHNRASEANAAQVGEFGKGMQGRAYSILAGGLRDPSLRGTPEYATAWQILSNPRVDPNTGTVVVPDLSGFEPPAGRGATPGGAPQQRMPSIQAFAPPNPSQPEALSAGFANRMSDSTKQIEENQGALGDVGQHMRGGVPLVGNFLTNPQYQKGDQAQRNFINAQLRRESGAAISESEFDNARKQYIPQPGDSKEVLAQKKSNRDMAVRNMQLSAGNTLLPPGVIQQASPPRGAPMVPQQQGFGQAQGNNDPLGLRGR